MPWQSIATTSFILASCHPYSENFQFSIGKSHASEVEAIATETFQGIDTHAAQYILEFKTPATEKMGQPSSSDIGVNPLGQPGIRSTDAPSTFSCVALLAEGTAEGNESSSSNVDGIGT